jgi:hypothetical protein
MCKSLTSARSAMRARPSSSEIAAVSPLRANTMCGWRQSTVVRTHNLIGLPVPTPDLRLARMWGLKNVGGLSCRQLPGAVGGTGV